MEAAALFIVNRGLAVLLFDLMSELLGGIGERISYRHAD